MFSVAISFHCTCPASPEIKGISSTITNTRVPAPKLQPLPPLIFACPSVIFTPGIWSIAVWISVVFLFSIKLGFITSIDTVISSIFCSNLPAETTTVLNCSDEGTKTISRVVISFLFKDIVFNTSSYPIYLKVICCSPTFPNI